MFNYATYSIIYMHIAYPSQDCHGSMLVLTGQAIFFSERGQTQFFLLAEFLVVTACQEHLGFPEQVFLEARCPSCCL